MKIVLVHFLNQVLVNVWMDHTLYSSKGWTHALSEQDEEL